MVHVLAPGLILLDIDLACYSMPAFGMMESRVLMMNWCARGRCEVDLGPYGSAVEEAGLFCVSSTMPTAFAYPLGAYRGFEVLFDPNVLGGDAQALFDCLSIDVRKVERRLCASTPALTVSPTGALSHVIASLADSLDDASVARETLLSGVCHLLTLLSSVDVRPQRVSSAYLRRSQRDLARILHDAILEEPRCAGLPASIAADYGVGEATLRSYFGRMYGEAPAAFARRVVLGAAASQLSSTSHSVSDIAAASGYSNPSKFSAAFKREYGVNPLEYRRAKRLGADAVPCAAGRR
ncbi:MAG: AraC family transcriptional regulator [Eggerthellaceae bacterium]|nr:AraC family transcriptional regulator [Eggerthellaceae bacterium]